MARHIRIPGLLDMVRLSEPEEIRDAANQVSLDRGYAGRAGPPLNRLIAGRASRALRIGEVPLSSAAMRGDPARQESQRTLSGRLGDSAGAWNAAALDALADYIRDRTRKPLGLLAQQAVGRLFAPEYEASRRSWRAAELLDAAVRSFNPARRAIWALTDAVRSAQVELGRQVGNDPAAIHATGIAVHTFAHSIERLREVLADPALRSRLGTRAALSRAVTAPGRVLRVASAETEVAGIPVAPGTLVIFEMRTPVEMTRDRPLGFLSGVWSQCPAQGSVPAGLAEIWARATGERLGTAGEKR
jgi:hypothetical protein